MKTILVVDDEADIRQFLELVLGEVGHRILSAEDGQEALAQVRKQAPDLVLLDLMMPDMDGWEVLAALKQDAGTSVIPVVLISARTEGHGEEVWRARGAAGFIAKPFHLRPLLRRIDDLFSAMEAQRAEA